MIRQPIRNPLFTKRPIVKMAFITSLMFLHGGDVCPLESQVAVVLELSGASVCGE